MKAFKKEHTVLGHSVYTKNEHVFSQHARFLNNLSLNIISIPCIFTAAAIKPLLKILWNDRSGFKLISIYFPDQKRVFKIGSFRLLGRTEKFISIHIFESHIPFPRLILLVSRIP